MRIIALHLFWLTLLWAVVVTWWLRSLNDHIADEQFQVRREYLRRRDELRALTIESRKGLLPERRMCSNGW
ncbi:hypothetical protein NA78x_006096 [Anatilimnocola sp. NA78]|uniref:hypothetical protein n=1 Tax=Anatilimnocola sp. NA78 TaxID=3415683 RepID=UPI003CE4FD85